MRSAKVNLKQTNIALQDSAQTNAEKSIGIKRITKQGKEPVYNMQVENHHNYSVNGGFILHNCDALRGFCIMRPIEAVKPPDESWKDEDWEDDLDSFINYGG